MAKLTLADVSNILGNPTSAANTINANNALVEAALEKTLSRDGTTPNQQVSDLDLDNNDLLNAGQVHADELYINGALVTPDELQTIPSAVMTKAVYDPNLVQRDVFDRRNTGEFDTKADAQAFDIPSFVTLIHLNGNLSKGDGDGGPYTSTNNGSPVTFTSNGGGRTWYKVADIGFGRINIGAQPGPKGVEYFNNSLTRCSAGNFSVDFNALQAGLNSEYAVDIAGQKLQIEDTVVITQIESMLMSSITHQRNGSGDVKRSANIQVMDNALPILFDVQTYNTRFDGFRVNCDPANVTTRHFNFTRPTNVNDIDTSIKRCVFEYGLSVLRTYGRGLQFNENEVVGTSDMAIELEWNPAWVSNGQSNDQDGTAQRAYTITQIRQHGCKGLVKNVGSFKKQISDILISDIQGDTGGVIFEGVLKHSTISNIHSWTHPVTADQIVLHGGSQYSTINNFNCGGFYQASPLVDRTPNRFFNIQPTDADPIVGIVFSNGVTGPTNTSSRITGGGTCDITFDNVSFVDVGMISNPNEWIFVASSGGTIVDFSLRLKNCRFRAAQDASPPTTIVGGNQNPLIKVYRDSMTTQEGLSVSWTAPNMTHNVSLNTNTGTATYDPPSLADGAGVSTTVTVPGAALGDIASASFSLSTQGITVTADVTSANTVTVRFQNETGGVIDLGSGTLKAVVFK